MTARALFACVLLGLGITGCSQYPIDLHPEPEPGPRILSIDRWTAPQIDIELPTPSHVAVFTIDQSLSMQHPLVPVSELERIYGASVEMSNARILDFKARHPWPHPDSVPDPFQVSGPLLPAGQHEIQPPYAPFIIQDLTYPFPCTYVLLVASGSPFGLGGIMDLQWSPLPRSPREIATAVTEALGLSPDEPGWGAQLERGRCERRE